MKRRPPKQLRAICTGECGEEIIAEHPNYSETWNGHTIWTCRDCYENSIRRATRTNPPRAVEDEE